MQGRVKKLLKGAVDMHCHPGPDMVERMFDVFQVAEELRTLGMRAFVIKNHQTPSSMAAWAVNREYNDVQAIGSVCLNFPIGGLNPAAVNVQAKMGAKVVWFPTVSSENHMEYMKKRGGTAGGAHAAMAKTAGVAKGITIIRSNGEIIPDVEPVLNAIAENNMLLHSGHISPDEVYALADAAKSTGVKKMIATHVSLAWTNIPVERCIELAKKGVMIEHVSSSVIPKPAASKIADTVKETVEKIKRVGAEHSVLGSDIGMIAPGAIRTETECWDKAIGSLLDNGIAESEITTMMRTNAVKLIDLKP